MKRILLCLCLVICLETAHPSSVQAESLAVLASRVDWSCVQFKIIGVCRRKTPPYVGAKVRYWQPVLLVETVKKPGDTTVNEFKPLLGAWLEKALEMQMKAATGYSGFSASGAIHSDDTSGVEMNEAHVFGFPFADIFSTLVAAPCEGAPDLAGTIGYLSELDAKEWRVGTMENKTAGLLGMLSVGSWGRLYPRTGWAAGTNELVGSGLHAYRAIDIASFKPGTPHVVLSRAQFIPDLVWDRMQLIAPLAGRCMPIGQNPQLWEASKRSPDGKYTWVFWRKKQCCLF